jgi:3-oxoacyl-(acyl-carrier-protein) synthase
VAFPITGVAIVNALGASADEVASNLGRGESALRRVSLGSRSVYAGCVDASLPDAPSRAQALLSHAAAELAPALAGARNRWGSRRLAVVLGCPRDPEPLLHTAAMLTRARGPIYAVTTGALASAQAIVSAAGLLSADLADAVAVGAATTLDLDASDLGESPPRPFSPHSTARAPGEGAAWLLLERQATSELELLSTTDSLDVATADWVIADATGDPQRDRDRLDAHRRSAPLVALAGYWGDLGPAHGLTAAVAAVLALGRGIIPASCLYDGHDRRIPTRTIDRDCDRVACTSSHGSMHVTSTIGARPA